MKYIVHLHLLYTSVPHAQMADGIHGVVLIIYKILIIIIYINEFTSMESYRLVSVQPEQQLLIDFCIFSGCRHRHALQSSSDYFNYLCLRAHCLETKNHNSYRHTFSISMVSSRLIRIDQELATMTCPAQNLNICQQIVGNHFIVKKNKNKECHPGTEACANFCAGRHLKPFRFSPEETSTKESYQILQCHGFSLISFTSYSELASHYLLDVQSRNECGRGNARKAPHRNSSYGTRCNHPKTSQIAAATVSTS